MQTKRHLDTQNILFVRLFLNSIIDGTVEGTDIYLIDGRIDYDHTYYGNGCPNSWGGSDGSGGSVTSCSTRMIKTSDNEDQKNGTYYIFQAATVGSGAAITTDNTNSPDTFCPLGWQLPYGGTGGDYYDKTKSWNYLIESNNISVDSSAGSEQLRSYPLSFASGGIYYWGTGRLYYQTVLGYYWSSTNNLRGMAYRMTIPYGSIILNETNAKSTGNTIRCAYMLSIPFIDGTVEGTNIFREASWNNNYYGNGCPNGWNTTIGPPSYGGSETACSSRHTKTMDNETQSIGTYYTYHLATLGSIGSITANNSNASDTFCPLGWQMPYGGTGGDYFDKSKSWKYLVETIYHLGGTDGPALQSYPFSYVRSGGNVNGYLHFFGGLGRLSSKTIASGYNHYIISISSVYELINISRAEMYPIRCDSSP